MRMEMNDYVELHCHMECQIMLDGDEAMLDGCIVMKQCWIVNGGGWLDGDDALVIWSGAC